MKIFTIHGTFASDPLQNDEGSRWWQRGSSFCRELADELGIKETDIIPFHWDGKNSEKSREAAGRLLTDKIIRTINNDPEEEIGIVSHSHGGNVVFHAFRHSVAAAGDFTNITKWVSVGTPFFESKNKILSVLNVGKMGLPVFVFVLALFSFGLIFEESFFFSAILFGVFLCAGLFLAFLIRVRRETQIQKHVNQYLGKKLSTIVHSADEALAVLKSMQHVKIDFSGNEQFLPFLTSLFFFAGTFSLLFFFDSLKDLIFGSGVIRLDDAAFFVLTLTPLWLMCLMLSWIFAYPASYLLKYLSNRFVKRRLIASANGWDTPNRYLLKVGNSPSEKLHCKEIEISQRAEKEIIRSCDTNLAIASKEIRHQITMMGLGKASFASAKQTVSASERQILVHNMYFEDPEVLEIIFEELSK